MASNLKEITICSSSSNEMDKNINNLIQTITNKYPDEEYNVNYMFQYATPIVVKTNPLQLLFSTQVWIEIEPIQKDDPEDEDYEES